MGNANQLTGAPRVTGGQLTAAKPSGKSWQRTVLYGAGTVSMLILSMAGSLALWIALPYGFLGWSPTLVTSGSMEPLVTPGDVVMVRPVAADALTPNSVVLFDRPGTGRVLHRILERFPDGTYRTAGDANPVPDSEPVRLEHIEGAAVLAVPWIGRPSLWLHQERTVLVAVSAVVLLVMLRLAPRAFDPAFDPWASGLRVNPAEVLLGRSGGTREARKSGTGRRLLPENLHDLVLDRLAAQSLAAQHRTVRLLEGLS